MRSHPGPRGVGVRGIHASAFSRRQGRDLTTACYPRLAVRLKRNRPTYLLPTFRPPWHGFRMTNRKHVPASRAILQHLYTILTIDFFYFHPISGYI